MFFLNIIPKSKLKQVIFSSKDNKVCKATMRADGNTYNFLYNNLVQKGVAQN
jgi:hypothetical protein